MARKTFGDRLETAMRVGNLTIADLARWFNRPHATLRGWLNGSEPGGGPQDVEDAHKRLADLEVKITDRKFFPVPRLSPAARIQHLKIARMR